MTRADREHRAVEALRERGHDPAFIDIGGGIPMSYLDDEAAWERFWSEHREALLGAARAAHVRAATASA